MVHDSARVFRFFDGELFFRLRLDVEADQLDSPDRQEFMKQFDSSYETIEETNGVKYRYFDHVKDGNQPRMASWSTRSRGLRRSGLRARAQSMPDRHPGLWSGRYRRPVECELGAARTCTAVEVRASRAARDDVAGAAGVDDGRLFEETDAGLLDSVALPRRRSYSGEIQVGIRHGSSRPRALSWSKANSESSRQSPHRSTDPVSIASELSHSAT